MISYGLRFSGARPPHLIEKLRMLAQGSLVRLLDIFDLALHATPLLIVALKLWRQWRASRP
ncbi:MAG: hypothetical protein KA711_17860 [Ideonella sp. WA131b]|nr:hypothetical protein [Ideonella sp. WA131b]